MLRRLSIWIIINVLIYKYLIQGVVIVSFGKSGFLINIDVCVCGVCVVYFLSALVLNF